MEQLEWKDGEYNASHKASNVGIKIRHVFDPKKRLWLGYTVWTGRTTGWWQWNTHLGDFQTLSAAQQAVESHMRWRGG